MDKVIAEFFCDDYEIFQEIAHSFLERLPEMLEQVQVAVASGDFKRIQKAAHSLKGSMSSFGEDAPVSIAQEIEMMGRNATDIGLREKLVELETRTEKLATSIRSYIASRETRSAA